MDALLPPLSLSLSLRPTRLRPVVRLPRRVRGCLLRLAWRPVAGMIRRPSADSADRDRLRPRR